MLNFLFICLGTLNASKTYGNTSGIAALNAFYEYISKQNQIYEDRTHSMKNAYAQYNIDSKHLDDPIEQLDSLKKNYETFLHARIDYRKAKRESYARTMLGIMTNEYKMIYHSLYSFQETSARLNKMGIMIPTDILLEKVDIMEQLNAIEEEISNIDTSIKDKQKVDEIYAKLNPIALQFTEFYNRLEKAIFKQIEQRKIRALTKLINKQAEIESSFIEQCTLAIKEMKPKLEDTIKKEEYTRRDFKIEKEEKNKQKEVKIQKYNKEMRKWLINFQYHYNNTGPYNESPPMYPSNL